MHSVDFMDISSPLYMFFAYLEYTSA